MKYYTTQGDMWDGISKKVYGNEKYAGEIMKANPEYAEVYIFGAEVELNIPDIDLTPKPKLMPPWRSEA